MTVWTVSVSAKFSSEGKELQSACLSELLVPTRLEAGGWCPAKGAQRIQHGRTEEEYIMAGYLQPCGLFLSLPDMQVPEPG